MPTGTINYGTQTAFGSVANLNSLANNNAEPLGTVDNSATKALDEAINLEIALNSTGVSATGTIDVYLLESPDDTDWTDGIDADASTDQAASIKNAKRIAILNANANSQVVKFMFRLLDYIANVPKFWGLLIHNKSGAAFASSGHDCDYTPLKYDSA